VHDLGDFVGLSLNTCIAWLDKEPKERKACPQTQTSCMVHPKGKANNPRLLGDVIQEKQIRHQGIPSRCGLCIRDPAGLNQFAHQDPSCNCGIALPELRARRPAIAWLTGRKRRDLHGGPLAPHRRVIRGDTCMDLYSF
jgi:hypothetical protein